MENQPIPAKKIILNYGLYLGIASIIISVGVYAMGMQYDQDWKTGLIGMAAMAVIIFLGIKKYRELNNGFLTLGQALKAGIGIALIGGIISLIYTLIFMNFIEPDYMANSIVKAEEKLIEQYPDFTDEQIEQQMAMVKKFSSPIMTGAMSIIASLILGLIFSLISGLILKKSDEEVTSI